MGDGFINLYDYVILNSSISHEGKWEVGYVKLMISNFPHSLNGGVRGVYRLSTYFQTHDSIIPRMTNLKCYEWLECDDVNVK